jgi:hypothetical protein
MATSDPAQGFFTGQLLIAMPTMPDPRFARTVIYMCAHSDEGALGLVVNKLFDDLNFEDLLDQVGIEPESCKRSIPVHSGGPVEAGRGFVLHSKEFTDESTMVVDEDVALTATARGNACSRWAIPAGARASSNRRSMRTAGSTCRRTRRSSSIPTSRTNGSVPSPRSASISPSCRASRAGRDGAAASYPGNVICAPPRDRLKPAWGCVDHNVAQRGMTWR